MKRCILGVSGGMDSAVILHQAKKEFGYDEIYALTFNYGQRHHWEIGYAEYQCKQVGVTSHKIIDLTFLKGLVQSSALTNLNIPIAQTKTAQGEAQTTNYFPCRNTIMLSLALAHAESVGANVIFHGAAQLDTLAGFYDGSPEYLVKINELAALNRKHRITIEAPLINLSKRDIVLKGIELGVDFKMTHTCYNPYLDVKNITDKTQAFVGRLISCGTCTACGGRIKGWIDAQKIDPLSYAVSIPWEQYGCK